MIARRFLAVLILFFATACTLSSCAPVHPWPPETREVYPDLEMFDGSGAPVKLSELKSKVLLIQPVRMVCSACQSFSGSGQWGPFGAVLPQAGLPSIETLLDTHAHGVQRNADFQIVQIIFFNFSDAPPTPADIREWDKHFHLHQRNILVLGARKPIADNTARSLIPGFQLVDKNFVLRADSTGSTPRQDLTHELLPMIPKLLADPSTHS